MGLTWTVSRTLGGGGHRWHKPPIRGPPGRPKEPRAQEESAAPYLARGSKAVGPDVCGSQATWSDGLGEKPLRALLRPSTIALFLAEFRGFARVWERCEGHGSELGVAVSKHFCI